MREEKRQLAQDQNARKIAEMAIDNRKGKRRGTLAINPSSMMKRASIKMDRAQFKLDMLNPQLKMMNPIAEEEEPKPSQ